MLEGIKDVVRKIQSDEYELAKKNEQIKKDIDSKIHSESNRYEEISGELKSIEEKNIKLIKQGYSQHRRMYKEE